MKSTLQVLMIEDDIDLATSVIEYLGLENIECDYAANGPAGLNLAQDNHYQVILLDINLPGMNGLDICANLRQSGNDTPILMLTARDTVADKLSGFDVGTDDYLIKPFDTDELVARIKALSQRRSAQAKKLHLADLELDLSKKCAKRNGKKLEFSPTEWAILEYLMRASPNIVSRTELEEAVWQGEVPDSNSLKVHLYRLRQKVDKPFKHSLIHTIPNHGLALRENDEK